MTLKENMNRFIDEYALVVAMVIDLVLGIVFFLVISPDFLTAIGMVLLAILTVFFKVRAYQKGEFTLWALFMILTWWGSTSFAIVATGAQDTVIEAEKQTSEKGDTELARLTDLANQAAQSVRYAEKREQEVPTGYSGEFTRRHQATQDARAASEKAEKDRKDYIDKKSSTTDEQAVKHNQAFISAATAFTAIPSAIASLKLDQWIRLLFFGMLFAGLERTIVVAASEPVPKKREYEETTTAPAQKETPIAIKADDESLKVFAGSMWQGVGRMCLGVLEGCRVSGISERQGRKALAILEKNGALRISGRRAVALVEKEEFMQAALKRLS